MATRPSEAKPGAVRGSKSRSSTPKAASKAEAKPRAAKVAAQAETAVTETVVSADVPEPKVRPAGEVLKLRALIEQVTAATGGKKKGVKETIEATLSALAAALAKGHDLNLPPLGKAKVSRQKGEGEGGMMVIKLKPDNGKTAEKKNRKDAPEGVAEADE
ncbi:HU family DNA-binding protein [Gemmobacter denitrificans]|uniref:HU family DNA-binding protein n=1 Tax=Gemmobacter denitrificans TaxID=3123040 RepID=A0ABU8BT95_9RHOB